jgi:hypothetical protein
MLLRFCETIAHLNAGPTALKIGTCFGILLRLLLLLLFMPQSYLCRLCPSDKSFLSKMYSPPIDIRSMTALQSFEMHLQVGP